MGDRLVETVIAQQREREFDRGIPDAALKSMMPDFWGLLKEESEFGKSPAKQPGHRVVYFCKFCVFRLHFVRKVICCGTADDSKNIFSGAFLKKRIPRKIFFDAESCGK
jgi:hypothetical protein